MTKLSIMSAGVRSALGANLEQTFHGLRARKLNIQRTAHRDANDEYVGAFLDRSISPRVYGFERWLALGVTALRDAVEGIEGTQDPLPIVLTTSASDVAFGQGLIDELTYEAGIEPDRKASRVLLGGTIATALAQAEELFAAGRERVVVGAVDSNHDPARYAHWDDERRLFSLRSADGFIPSEAAAFLVLERGKKSRAIAEIVGVHTSLETADPDIATAWTGTVESALRGAELPVPWVIVDLNGERHRARSWNYVEHRLKRELDLEKTTVLPLAQEMGEPGVASGCLSLAIACAGFMSGAAPGPEVLVAQHGEGNERVAALLKSWAADLRR